jgi:Serine acetyltransferase, N-terminal
MTFHHKKSRRMVAYVFGVVCVCSVLYVFEYLPRVDSWTRVLVHSFCLVSLWLSTCTYITHPKLYIPMMIGMMLMMMMISRDNEAQLLRGALWDEQHYDLRGNQHQHQHQHQHRNNHVVMDTIWDDTIVTTNTTPKMSDSIPDAAIPTTVVTTTNNNNPDMMNANHNRGLNDRYSNYSSNKYEPPYPKVFYPNIDLSIPDTVYSDHVDLVWDLLRWEAYQNQQQQHEPLLVSFLHSTILNHDSLEPSCWPIGYKVPP